MEATKEQITLSDAIENGLENGANDARIFWIDIASNKKTTKSNKVKMLNEKYEEAKANLADYVDKVEKQFLFNHVTDLYYWRSYVVELYRYINY